MGEPAATIRPALVTPLEFNAKGDAALAKITPAAWLVRTKPLLPICPAP